MVVCKCRKATKLYCFVHKVPVCGECVCFPEHQICVVRTYSEWVIDGEYDWPPKCCQCLAVLDEGSGSQTTRLGCLHVMHTNCLVSHIKSYPPHTAPAGFVCPSCSTTIWPPENFKDSESQFYSQLKDSIMQTGTERNLFGNHPVTKAEPYEGVERGRSSNLIPNRQRQPTTLVGRRGFFWEFDGRKPDGKVIWKVWISFGERHPKVFNTYSVEKEYKIEEYKGQEDNNEGGDGDGDEGDVEGVGVDQDVEYETAANDLQNIGAVKFFCYRIKEIFNFVLFDLLGFISTVPPPASIVFVSGNAAFAPFLRKLKEKGYHVLIISNTECASSAFQDAGLTLYDWIPVINGEGFFPLEERDLPLSKKRDYASFSKEEAH